MAEIRSYESGGVIYKDIKETRDRILLKQNVFFGSEMHTSQHT